MKLFRLIKTDVIRYYLLQNSVALKRLTARYNLLLIIDICQIFIYVKLNLTDGLKWESDC